MGGSAPQQDPAMGEAAKASAQTGRDMLEWMKGQSTITNGWAETDRNRSQTVFQPLENQMIADAAAARDPAAMEARAANEAARAEGDVRTQFGAQRGQMVRSMGAMGVAPTSGRFMAATQGAGQTEALAAAGAGNLARRASLTTDRQRADGLQANVVNLGRGLVVNPGTSMGLSNSAGASGFQGAQQGYGQQASILNTDYQNRVQAYQAKQQSIGGLMGGLGAVVGAGLGPGGFLASSLLKAA